jgi:hypothetical protein
MSKAAFSTNDKLNKSIDRAQKRREIVDAAIAAKMQEYDAGQPSDKFAYMTGYMNSLLGSIAQAETVAEMRRVFNYSGIEI